MQRASVWGGWCDHEELPSEACGGETVPDLDCGSGYMISTCDKMTQNHTHVLHRCQGPGFDIVL